MVQGIASFMGGSTREQQLRQQSKEKLLNTKTPIQKRRERRAGLKGGEGGTGGIGKFATQLGAGVLPGSGVADVVGAFPDVEGGYEPSMLVNLQQAKRSFQEGNYKQALIQGVYGGLQGLGGASDVALAAAPFTPFALPVALAGKTVSTVGKSLVKKAMVSPKLSVKDSVVNYVQSPSLMSRDELVKSLDSDPTVVEKSIKALKDLGKVNDDNTVTIYRRVPLRKGEELKDETIISGSHDVRAVRDADESLEGITTFDKFGQPKARGEEVFVKYKVPIDRIKGYLPEVGEYTRGTQARIQRAMQGKIDEKRKQGLGQFTKLKETKRIFEGLVKKEKEIIADVSGIKPEKLDRDTIRGFGFDEILEGKIKTADEFKKANPSVTFEDTYNIRLALAGGRVQDAITGKPVEVDKSLAINPKTGKKYTLEELTDFDKQETQKYIDKIRDDFGLNIKGTETKGIASLPKEPFNKIFIKGPFDRLIASGKKTLETRGNRLPEKYIGKPLVMKNEKNEAVGEVTFKGSRKIETKEEFDSLRNQHLVEEGSPFDFGNRKQTYVWEVDNVKKYSEPQKIEPMKGQAPIQMQGAVKTQEGIAALPTKQGATKVENMLKPKTEIRSEGGFKFAPEKIKQNVQLQKVRIAKMNEGKTPAGEPLNERIEIKAPKGSNLPNFVVGKIKPKDWQERTEKLLSDEEIEQASNWYNEVYDYFKKAPYTKDDEEAKQLARAWFASQQNKSPAQGVAHVLSIRNLLREGKSPEEILAMEKIPAGGLEGANKAILSVLTGREVEGVGSKISDFRDALDGKNVRSFMGNDTIGGQPFVVDVHTGRDTGLVDKPLLNVLEAKGYTIPKNIKLDFGKKQEGLQGGGVPSGQYENRSVFGNELTEYLNSVNWKGKNDWEPAQIQAIGWTALTNFYGGVNTAGNIKDALNLNVQRISMEVAPGDGSPWAKMFGEDFSKLSVDNQSKINKDVTDEAIKKISEAENVDLYNNVFGTGGWQTFVNPSTVQEILGSKDQAVRIASKLGYVLNQTEMYVNATKKLTSDPEAYAFDIVEVGSEKLKDSKYVNELFSKIYEKTNGVVVGFHPLLTVDKEPAIRMIVGPEKIKKFYEDNKLAKSRKENQLKKNNFFENDLKEQIKSVILGEDADYGLVLREADLTVLKNEWNKKGQQNGQNYVRHFSKGRQSGTKDDGFRVLDNIRQELTDFFRQKIRDAQGVKTPNEEVVEIIEDPPPINKKAFGGFVESSNYDHYRII